MIDLHRHDEFSTFDGFGKPSELAKIAKEKGFTALGTANHGNVDGMIEHYLACKLNEIKPVLGIEAYFEPTFKAGKYYHLCLFAKNLKGYQNINQMVYSSNKDNFYYKPRITFELLEKHSEGVICTSACIGGYLSSKIIDGKVGIAAKAARKFKSIFKENYYIEIMPYKLSKDGLQETVNRQLMKIAEDEGIDCILTSDSHYGKREDFDTYKKMHEMSGSTYAPGYMERYMPSADELRMRFIRMHSGEKKANLYMKNLQKIEDGVELDIFANLKESLPKFSDNSKKVLQIEIKKGLRDRGIFTQEYIERCKKEYLIISQHGFEDYFLIVQDYVNYAKSKSIKVGPGRGSVCNCLIAYVLGITDVDPVYFGLDFTRFLRDDKKKLPDIDLDFETDRRAEVIDYIIATYPGQAAQICSYGLFKIDNALNELFKVCGVSDKYDQNAIKDFVRSNVDKDSQAFDYSTIKENKKCIEYNYKFDNIIKHFSKFYKKIRYIGTHAAGVAIVGTNILDYTAIERRGLKYSTAFDLNNLEAVKVIKFDMLGLKTMSEIKELEDTTGELFSYSWLEDDSLFKEFQKENTDGIFQFEKQAVKNILREINADCMEDIIAANAMNRPGPLQLRMPEQYIRNKDDPSQIKSSKYYKYTKDTYGTILYQEQITAICRGLGKLSWQDSDKVLKFMKGTQMTERHIAEKEKNEAIVRDLFIIGAKESGMKKAEAYDTFQKLVTYSFNKGHATGYAMIAVIEMYYKIHYPLQFWYVKMKNAPNEVDLWKYESNAAEQGILLLLPHVNGSNNFSLRKIENEDCIQLGLSSVKGVGEKAAIAIETERNKNGRYKNLDDFLDRLEKRTVNSRAVKALEESGALEFNKKQYYSRVEKYNMALYSRGVKK